MNTENDQDPWRIGWVDSGQANSAEDRAQNLRIVRIKGAKPLADRIGPCVPEPLMPVLFPQDAKVNCFAVLDAGLLEDLPGVLERSGLEHMCLFRDEALDSLKDVAPYLVRLTPEADLTRRIFTKSESRWDLWGRGAGILLRSPAPLAETGKHLRKFTKVTTSGNKTLFLKFWHEAVMNAFCADEAADPLAIDFLTGVDVIYLSTTGMAGAEMRLVTLGGAPE
jgi:Domain of unknown function (DUF4123)